MEKTIKETVMFVVLLLLQVLLFGNIDYMGYICPYVYILFILALPIGFNIYASMGLAFLMGLFVDMFSNTPGVHIAASVVVAFSREYWFDFIMPHSDIRDVEPSLGRLGVNSFLKYTIGLVLLHHLILFFAEAWSFAGAWFTIAKALLNTIVTTLFILCYYIISKK